MTSNELTYITEVLLRCDNILRHCVDPSSAIIKDTQLVIQNALEIIDREVGE